MADKLFPWTEIVPEIEAEDYIWSCIDTEITELPDIISWCYPGQFRSLARVRFGGDGALFTSYLRTQFHSRPHIEFAATSNIPTPRYFVSGADVGIDLTSNLNRSFFFASTTHIQSVIISTIRQVYHAETNIQTSIISTLERFWSLASTANIVSDISSSANAERSIAVQVDIVSDIVSNVGTEREIASSANIDFFLSTHMPDHRYFAAQADIVSDITDPILIAISAPFGAPLAWYKADSLSLSDDDPVTNWDDSANSYNLSQSDVGLKPTFKTDIQNSLPGVFFDGSEQIDTTLNAFGHNSQPITIQMAFTITSVDVADGWGFIFSSLQNNERIAIFTKNLPATYSVYANTTRETIRAAVDNEDIIMTLVLDSGGTMKVNGLPVTLSGDPGGKSLDDIRLFGHHSDTQYNATGYMYEVLVYDSALSTEEIISNESYLNTKWNIFQE
jgi:hypothetical protein